MLGILLGIGFAALAGGIFRLGFLMLEKEIEKCIEFERAKRK